MLLLLSSEAVVQYGVTADRWLPTAALGGEISCAVYWLSDHCEGHFISPADRLLHHDDHPSPAVHLLLLTGNASACLSTPTARAVISSLNGPMVTDGGGIMETWTGFQMGVSACSNFFF